MGSKMVVHVTAVALLSRKRKYIQIYMCEWNKNCSAASLSNIFIHNSLTTLGAIHQRSAIFNAFKKGTYFQCT